MSFVITLGREYGSGGRYIASELAKKLNVNFYDGKLLEKVAEKAGFSLDYVQSNDEKKDNYFFGYNMFSSEVMSAAQRVATEQFKVIEHLAQTESCVIVGRCSNYILRDHNNVVNVFIYAQMKEKIARAVKYYNLKEKKAKEMIEKIDKQRASYFNFFTNMKWGRRENYDLCINSSIGIEECTDLIIQYLKYRFPNENI